MIHDLCPCCEVARPPHKDDCTFADDCPNECAIFDYEALAICRLLDRTREEE